MTGKPGRRPAKGVTGATRATRTVALAADVLRGDPAAHVIGKPDEKPARKHAPLPPKPEPTARTILASVQLRRQELEPLVKEAAELEAALEALKNV